MRIDFSKYEGLGNDFVLVDGLDLAQPPVLSVTEAQRICDRHRGVGGDGVLLVDAMSGRPRMRVINADGSVPEMCGNGIRCVALHLARRGRAPEGAFAVETDAGPHLVRVLDSGAAASRGDGERDGAGMIEVAMRAASLQPTDVPVHASAPLRDELLELGGARLHWTLVSMGNPHAVTFDDVGTGQARAELAPRVQNAALFPNGVNVGFARMLAPGALELAVYERGSGWTEACGTGACAAAVAAVETGRAQRGQPISVQLPGGTLTIVVPEPGERVLMTGPARHVFDGVVEI